jgi:cytochrome c551/c552
VRGVVERVVDGLVGAHDLVVTRGRIVLASPLADAVAVLDLAGDARRVLPLRDARHPPPSPLARLGEALVFSTALAPEQDSDGIGSRFTCEACHDDGGSDGRLHSSGRFADDGEVMVSTKPLRGLFQNPPLFSRAYDDSVAAMVHAEVRVANAGSARDPWTPLVPALDAPFLDDVLHDVGGDAFGDVIDPVTQRRAMLHFFAGYAPAPVPSSTMAPTRADWGVFQARCQGCHQPRVFTDDPASVVDDDRAADLARLRGLVWASERRVDVGVRPLVREGGARVSSLRGVADKRPLLTNGSAPTLEALLRQLRLEGSHVWHDGPPTRGTPLADDDVDALLRVLRSL